MSPPAIPSAAATLVLLRDRPSGHCEILLVQRHGRSKFAAGDYVFAGGKVEADDIPDDVEAFCRGLTGAEASARLGGRTVPCASRPDRIASRMPSSIRRPTPPERLGEPRSRNRSNPVPPAPARGELA